MVKTEKRNPKPADGSARREILGRYLGEYESVVERLDTALAADTDLNNLTEFLLPADLIQRLHAEEGAVFLERNAAGRLSVTPAGHEFLQQVVTDSESPVYAFYDFLSQATIAASMARLSRREDDMRITLLEEFSDPAKAKDEALLRRVISQYGDDSVQQLAGVHLVVEGASNLLTKKLEWGRLAAYLEQSTRYIYFDQKDAGGRFKYFVPEEVKASAKLDRLYNEAMTSIFDSYSSIVRQAAEYERQRHPEPEGKSELIAWRNATRAQACDAARGALPTATKSTVGIFASGQALESMVMRLSGDELAESRLSGQRMLNESRKVLSVFLERADKDDRGGATTAYYAETRQAMRDLVPAEWRQPPSPAGPTAELLDSNYANELDLIVDMLYEQAGLPWKTIEKETRGWSEQKKVEVFETYVGKRLNRRQKPGRAFEKLHYSWDIVCDYGIFRDLQRHRMVDDLNWQLLTPYLGYQTPELIKAAGLEAKYADCFRIASELYEQLAKAIDPVAAQYATLLGHQMRWKVTYNARQAFHMHELRTTPQGHPGYRKLVNSMHGTISQKHPHVGAAMRFVNQDEDPELTRMAAERAQQFKLNRLSQT